MKRLVIPLVALTILALAATPVAAKTTGIAYSCDEYPVAVLDEGTTETTGNVEHVRGLIVLMEMVGDDLCAGLQTTEVNYNLNLETSTGSLWGKATLETYAYAGSGFTSSWNAKWTAQDPTAEDAEDIWVGSYVRHGFGELDGWQARGKLLEKYHWLVLEEGVAFNPGS